MNLTVIILLATFAQVFSSTSYGQNVTLNLKKTSLETVLNSIEKQTGYNFIYNNKVEDLKAKITVKLENVSLTKALDECFSTLPVTYKIIQQTIVLDRKEILASAVEYILTGVVKDARTGETLPGVSVSIEGTTTAVSSDENGRYRIKVSTGEEVLVFSFIGFVKKSIPLSEQTELNVNLEPEVQKMEEVVVVGYGTQRQRDVTGAISKIGSKDIGLTPINSADQALQGRVSGVQVVQSSGAPGGAVQVRIRGVNSTAGGGANQPLYVVDGVPLLYVESINSISLGNEGSSGGAASNGASPLNTISPNDIESIEVLKDASATAIYGARAANGVVLITTKSGKIGKPQINFNISYGAQSLRDKIPVTNSIERAAYVFEHRRNRGTSLNDAFDAVGVNPFMLPKGTDWQEEIFRPAPVSNYNLGVSGGSDRVTYAISGDFLNHQGIVLNTYSKRTGIRGNIDVRATEKLKFGLRTNLSKQGENSAATDDFFQSDLNGLTTLSPIMPVRDANGNFSGRANSLIGAAGSGGIWGNGGGNAVANITERTRAVNRHRIISNLFGEYNILPSLKFRSSLGLDYLFTDLRSVSPYWARGIDINSPLSVFEGRNNTYNWVAEQTLNYDKQFGKHRVNAVGGFSAQNVRIRSMLASANGSVTNALDQLGNNPNFSSISGGVSDQALISQFVRANYSFQDKYLFTGTVRRDGSSRFGGNNKYGIFPSASVGWRLSEENFLKDNHTVSDLKLRASYGSTGSQEIGNFLYAALMTGSTAVFGNSYTPGLVPSRFQNEDIKWERNNQMDFGIDLGLFKNRVRLTMDYYDKRTSGLLAPGPLSVISGVGNSFTTNIGKIKNTGIEFAANAAIVKRKNFAWNLDFNISTNKNEVVSLGSQPFLNGANVSRANNFINRTEPGHPIGGFYLVQTNGLYQTWDQAANAPAYRLNNQPWFGPGDPIPVDQNKDGVIDDSDRVWSGSPFPDFFGGLTSTLNFKRLSLTVFAPFQHGNKVWNQPFLNASTFEGNTWRSIYEDRWTPSNPSAAATIPIPRNNNPILASPLYLQDGSFLRIRTISLAYEVPADKIKINGLGRLRLYAQANNFFVFTKYGGWDPEVNSFGSNVTTNGIDVGAYPQAKSVVIGANIGF